MLYRGKSLAIFYNGVPIGDLWSIRPFKLAGSQTCRLFENDLMATRATSKWLKEQIRLHS